MMIYGTCLIPFPIFVSGRELSLSFSGFTYTDYPELASKE